MANSNRPQGMVPVSHINGDDWNGGARQYYVQSTDTNAYYAGDIVTTAYSATDSVTQYYPAGLPQVTKVTASLSNPRGVMVSVAPLFQMIDQLSIPATKNFGYVINVVDDPLVVFEIQADNTTALTSAIIGKYADFNIANGAMSASGTQLASATISTNAALPLRILGLSRNSDYSAYAKLLVCFNIHELG